MEQNLKNELPERHKMKSADPGRKSGFLNERKRAILVFTLLSVYILSFLFQGQVLIHIVEEYGLNSSDYILISAVPFIAGYIFTGFFTKSGIMAKKIMEIGIIICLVGIIPFYLQPSFLWILSLIISGFAGASAMAAWGYFLNYSIPKDKRLASIALVLILPHLLMLFINALAVNINPVTALTFNLITLSGALFFIRPLSADSKKIWDRQPEAADNFTRRPLLILGLFIVIFSVDSGLMYQVINPAFSHLPTLVSLYWVVPYILAIALVNRISSDHNRLWLLYLGIAMIITAFIAFMFLGRTGFDYILIDTLMLGAFGIFDLFWWSVIAELQDFSPNPVKVYSLGITSNILGIFLGSLIGLKSLSNQQDPAQVTVAALVIVCITLFLLPPLIIQLMQTLRVNKPHMPFQDLARRSEDTIKAAPADYSSSLHASAQIQPPAEADQSASAPELPVEALPAFLIKPVTTEPQAVKSDPNPPDQTITPNEKLTIREEEVLTHLLQGKSTKEIAAELFISENTVKTHTRNIFSKYAVTSRAELLSRLLQKH